MMKKALCLLLVFLFAAAALPVGASAEAAQTPRIVETVYPTQDAVIADIVATEAPYSVDSTGEADVSAMLQRALNDCAAAGGGTVFLPVGRYRLCSPLSIPKFVTLRGDWQDPDEGTDYGTLLIADVPSADAMTPGLITVGASAGAVGLTVWYPEQSLEDVKPYPYTFYVVGNGDYMLQTVKDCTLLNSYRGIGASSECENGVSQIHEMFTVENVKGTCLYEGLNSYNSADVDTYQTVYIENKYWAQAGEAFNAPDEAALDAYTRVNAYGLVLGDLEWPQFADIRVSDRMTGVEFRKGLRYCFSGEFCGLYLENCDYGFVIKKDAVDSRGKTWGIAVCKGVIEGSKTAVDNEGSAALLLTDVTVKGKVKGKAVREFHADTAAFAPDLSRTYQKTAAELYVVAADKTGRTDASAAVQRVLDGAAETGGVVYLPGGVYRFDGPVTVPAGVELRGASSVPVRDQSGNSSGTLILSYYGYDDPDGRPLITLGGDNAGVNGLRVDFPLNNPTDESGDYRATVPAVYGAADGLYVTNCFITLASVGVRLENADDAFLKKVIGCCYETMFSLEGCGNAFIGGCLQNGNALPRNGYRNLGVPELADRLTEDHLFAYVFIPITRVRTEYITLKDCTDATIFQTFIYGGKTFLRAENSTVLAVNIGSDGSSHDAPTLRLSGGALTVLNSMRSTADGQRGYRYYETENKAALRSYGSMGVDLLYKESPVLENIKRADLRKGENLYRLLQPFCRMLAWFGRLTMQIKQK